MFVDGLFVGKKILVTGGGTGLAEPWPSDPGLRAEIAICGRRKAVCDATAEELMKAHGGRVASYGVDIRDAAAVEAMVEEISATACSPDSSITPPAISSRAPRTCHRAGRRYRQHRHARHLLCDAGCRQALDSAKQKGSVVSIAMTWCQRWPIRRAVGDGKAAIQAMTMSLAQEWGRHGIRLNAIAPGEIPTEGMSKRLMPGAGPARRPRAIRWVGSAGWRNCRISRPS